MRRTPGGYGEADQKEIATRILSQALQLANKDFAASEAALGKTDKSSESNPKRRSIHYLNKSLVLTDIAVAYYKSGQKEKAAQLFTQALTAAQSIRNGSIGKSEATLYMATKCIEIGESERASQILSQAHQAAQALTSEFFRLQSLTAVSGKYAEINYFSEAFRVADSIEHPYWTPKALANVAGEIIRYCDE